MKITRHKLNSILRSGLNPDIATRKQLAKILELDPTSLTRWFASHDRLGNPRYPVVPDRHVKSILRIFKLQLSDLNLSDEDFKQFCFDKALANTEVLSAAPATVESAPLAPPTSGIQNSAVPWFAFSVFTLLVFVFTVRSDLKVDSLYRLNQLITNSPNACWEELNSNSYQGDQPDQQSLSTFYPVRFSSSFKSTVEASERCSYNLILEQGLLVLDQNSAPKLDISLSLVDLLAFVDKKLGDSQIERKAILRFEMGRKEIRRQQFQPASRHFSEALELLASLPSVDKDLFRRLSTYSSLAHYGDKAWWYARQLSDGVFIAPQTESVNQGVSWRSVARADAAIGRTSLSSANIDRALHIDSNNLGYDHPVMASNWLLKSQILNLQGDLRQAREYAHRAIVLDTYLFGENHSRVAEDKMHYAMIILQEGRISEAREVYQSGYDFFSRYPFSNHSILKSGEKFLQSLHLLQNSNGLSRNISSDLSNNISRSSDPINPNAMAWDQLRQALMEHDFMLPRCMTTTIWQRLLKQQSIAI